jgi:hypothetical protein
MPVHYGIHCVGPLPDFHLKTDLFLSIDLVEFIAALLGFEVNTRSTASHLSGDYRSELLLALKNV